jgi:NADH-quinone oxidoreductase subunit F
MMRKEIERMPKITSPTDLAQLHKRLLQERNKYEVTVTLCSGTGCQASGSVPVHTALHATLEEKGISNKVLVRTTGCHGFCEHGPLMVIEPGDIFYCGLKAENIPDIVTETIIGKKVVERFLYEDPVTGKKIPRESDIPFYKEQNRILLGMNRLVDPLNIEDYIAIGGFSALAKALGSMSPEDIIGEIKKAQLRGRGGGGFPTAKKWETTRKADGRDKYIICNADEGDPGAYMNRSVLEGNPYAVLEGMLIAAYAIGAEKGFIYVRTEYPLAVRHSIKAIEQAREYGFLGENILGSGFSLDLAVARGAGAFVAGESTALMAALQGQVSEPRPKDVHTAIKGYKDAPSNLNNVETFATVPLIINEGADWFASQGTTKSRGTKIFALTGQIRNTGLVEVEFGTPISTILNKIGGGATNGKALKAIQIGGPSGGCIPASLFDLPVDYETLADAGSMVGSGGMVVMDEGSCMVDVARYFLEFLVDESCGKCVPCRYGVPRMLEIVTDITNGTGTEEQLVLLEDLCDTVAKTSLCALGKTAPNPVLTTLRYFRSEYETHVRERRCPAGVCRSLIHFEINEEACTGCGKCARACPQQVISGELKQSFHIDDEACVKCGICREECSFDAILVH